MTTLRREALRILCISDAATKAREARQLADALTVGADEALDEPPSLPGRTDRPELVAPASLKPRPVGTREGRAALLHALAHIELNAVNLALDLLWRFPGLPDAFYRDWASVARDEALHFQLLAARLATLDAAYGDFPAHNGLWEMAEKTRGDLLARIALVPRTLEARGLDASPPIRQKLLNVGDLESAKVLEIILRDEIRHVKFGNDWYRSLCGERGLDPVATYAQLAQAHRAPRLQGPFNLQARREAGFQEDELALLGQAPQAPV